MEIGIFNEAVEFFQNWLFANGNGNVILFETTGDLFNFTITGNTLCYGLAVASVLFFFISAVWLCKWLVNFVMGLGGRYD